MRYPTTRTSDVSDDFFGTTVADPYRWLEDLDSPETRAWIEAENRLTFEYLDRIPQRPAIRDLVTRLWNYERYGVPSKEGPFYVYARNDGLQNQAVIYRTSSLTADPDVLVDPNQLSADGTVALSGMSFTEDGRLMAYGLSANGSDWIEWHICDVATARDLPDLVRWSKFSDAAWRKDGSGFFYGRYDAPREGDAYQGVNKNQKVFFHQVGTGQEQDVLVYQRPDHPDWGFSTEVTDDGRFLLISQSEGTDPRNRVFIMDLADASSEVEPFLDHFDAEYVIAGNDGERFYVKTDKLAPRGRLVAIDRRNPEPESWEVLIPEAAGRGVLSSVLMVADRFLGLWLTDAHHELKTYDATGQFEAEIALPALGSIVGVSGRREQREAFYAFTSFTYPTTIFRVEFEGNTSPKVREFESPGVGNSETETAGNRTRGRRSLTPSVFRQPSVPFDGAQYETRQVFYGSKDGTRVPMFITHRRGLTLDGRHPTYLYGYGGFNISLTPSFSPADAAWLEMGGVHAVANLRGGGEYGKPWHDAGRLAQKQNVFDDFIAAAEYLIREGYTSTSRLAIGGGSNGGLLVGACLTQRPDLFGAAVAAVGVLDMLRFHKFTIGWAWTSDYGSAETREGFETLIRYSPLHNLHLGRSYPATFITTGDHDDRVVPIHSFKFAAALQAAQGGDAPILVRIDVKAGHGAGKPTTKLIEEQADKWAFLAGVLGLDYADSLH